MLLSPSEQRCPDSPCTSWSRKSSFDVRTRAKSDAAHVPGGGAAYECTLNLANGGKQVICAGLIKGVPAIDRSPCRAGSFPH